MHKANAVVILCMDFRFHDKIQEYLRNEGLLGHIDEISIAGGTRDFITPVEENDGRYVWKQLDLSVKLHDPDRIIFIDHQDCGGYAQDITIPSGLEKEEDIAKHKGYMEKLLLKLKEKYPEKEIVFKYAPFEGSVETIEM